MSDLISRDALLEDLRESVNWLHKIYGDLKYEDERRICSAEIASFTEVIMRVKDAPAVDAEPVRHGRWGLPEIVGYDGRHAVYACPCSVCFEYTELYKPNYCPNCGAKMDGGKQDD